MNKLTKIKLRKKNHANHLESDRYNTFWSGF
jgi:hypothetical protein